ncbi:MAG: TlpA family protein disulfide reductase [Methylotenera sp.]|nr:TlpA family protein disulfide reductase [Methylotenera sp.]
MLRIVRNLAFILFATCSFAHAAAIDQKTLELPITLLSGQTVKLSQYKGNKPVYLKFWATWCQSCLKQMPHLQHSFDKYGNKVEIIAVNIGVNDDQKSVAAIKKKFGLTMPIAIDKSGELAKAFNLIGTPYHVLLDASGNVAYAGYEETGSVSV